MKHCYNFLLVFTLFFCFAAGYNYNGDNWNIGETYAKENTTNCTANMRLFGPNNQYRCNCKNLQACDFSKNGKCNDNKCITGFKGPFCQRIIYHNYITKNNYTGKNLFEDGENIHKEKFIPFSNSYRINFIKVDCQISNPLQTVTLKISGKEFCMKNCSQNIECTGDETGKNLTIEITGNNQIALLSKMKILGCSPFWFGRKCDKQCHCENNEECHKFTGKCLNGCEKGRSGPDCQKLNYENVAMNKPASQNTIYNKSVILKNVSCKEMDFDFSANLAVDGNTDQQHERRSCMHTTNGNSQWSVNLGKKYNISQIRIYNRNKNTHRMINAVIKVDNQKCYKIIEPKKIYDIKCDSVIAGENITISHERGLLNFCEVEVLQCLLGFYGDRCSKNCSKCKNSSCDQWTGHCILGCAPGYWQYNTQMCEACSTGEFGENCTKTCHCKNNTYCPKETGICGHGGCETGYQGETCQEHCSYGKFGEGCLETCRCKNNIYCNKKNGTCGFGGCAAGYKEINCQPCSTGEFGEKCAGTCHCKDNKFCSKDTGICKYGCAAGFHGKSCQEPCPTGRFGESCVQTCHCKNNNYCNNKNGTCRIDGCEAGYKGYNCQEGKTNLFIPIIIGLLVFLPILAGSAIYFIIRKSKKKENKTSASGPNVSLPENVEMNFVVDNDYEEEEEVEVEVEDKDDPELLEEQESIYMNTNSIQNPTSEITKDNIVAYVKKQKLEDFPFATEFLKLPKGLLYAHTKAKEDKNKSKNRYKTILPYDHSIVCLHPDEHSSSDYINASYLTENKTYIATQGPLNSTIVDFWRMIYQTKCSIIVMLTKLSENGKLKSEQYWPEVNKFRTYGNINVSHKQEHKYSYYIYRQFCVSKNSEELWVEHYQFTSWPDHGVPKEPEKFIAFRNKLRSTPFYKPPILVHCSAGIGRSGTYIILDIILEEMKNKATIDVIGNILKLRKDRTLMVQNYRQLEFIYDVLVENILTGLTVVAVKYIPKIYNQLLKFPDKGCNSHMKLQYEKFILPFNTEIPKSSDKKGSSMSYDNEQYVDDEENEANSIATTILSGNNMEEEFILFGTPSEEQFANFWNVVFVKRCTLLIMLDSTLNEQATYWPQKKHLVSEYKHFAINLIDEQDNDFYVKRTMEVSSSLLNMPTLVVHQFQFRTWLGTDLPNPTEMVKMLKTIQSYQMNKDIKQFALHCQDGISKSGLFCVLYMITELLDRDSFISIVQLIRQQKRQKKEIIFDYMSYHHCWLVAKVFLEENSIYANEQPSHVNNG